MKKPVETFKSVMRIIRKRASQLGAFVALPDESCDGSGRGIRRQLDRAQMRWELLTWGWLGRVGRKIAWLFGRPVRRWRRSQGRYDVGDASNPMTVWEMRRALKRFDPHAPIVIDIPGSNGRVVMLNEWMLASGMDIAVLKPGPLDYEELGSRAISDFTYAG